MATVQGMRFVHELAHEPSALGVARSAIDDWCAGQSLDSEAIVIVANELCSNAIRHGNGPASLNASSSATWISLGVWQSGRATLSAPSRIGGDDLRLTGRGLQMVDALAQSWGWRTTAEQTVLWARMSRITE